MISIAVVTPGLDNIYRSANLGKTWTTFGIPSHLMRTANAGRTWYAVRV